MSIIPYIESKINAGKPYVYINRYNNYYLPVFTVGKIYYLVKEDLFIDDTIIQWFTNDEGIDYSVIEGDFIPATDKTIVWVNVLYKGSK